MSSPLAKLTKSASRREILSWAMPPLVIPVLRWFQDPPELRWKLFTRDFTTYSIGAGIFFGVRALMERALVGFVRDKGRRDLWAFLTALGTNLAFAGVGAIKLSKWVEEKWHQLPFQWKPSPPNASQLDAKLNRFLPRPSPFRFPQNQPGEALPGPRSLTPFLPGPVNILPKP